MGSLDESAQISFCPVLLIIITILIIYVTWVQVRCQNVAVYRVTDHSNSQTAIGSRLKRILVAGTDT